jgi:hypothetical protein
MLQKQKCVTINITELKVIFRLDQQCQNVPFSAN